MVWNHKYLVLDCSIPEPPDNFSEIATVHKMFSATVLFELYDVKLRTTLKPSATAKIDLFEVI